MLLTLALAPWATNLLILVLLGVAVLLILTVLIQRASTAGIEMIVLTPRLGDFNEDLRLLGFDALAAHLRLQVASEDVARFMSLAT